MKLRFPCVALDHDDTVVNSTATVHYPAFVEYMRLRGQETDISLEDYFRANFHPGVVEFFTQICGMTMEEMREEEVFWNGYVKKHVPKAYDGIREILEKYRARGGRITVVSHSYTENILRDYRENGLPEPDMIFGWESPPEERKPNTWPLERIMEKYSLKPAELLVVDDLKPGYDMALSAGTPFAAAGWANDIPEIESFMRKNSGWYLKTVDELGRLLLD